MLVHSKYATKRLITFTVLGLFFAIFPASASANSIGQCDGPVLHEVPVSTGLQLYNNWKKEGVTSKAAEIALKPAGYLQMDGSVKVYMTDHVAKMKLAVTTTFDDYGCRNGTVFGAGTRTFARGEWVMAALPPKYSMSEVRFTPHKGYKRVTVSTHNVGKVECSNPFPAATKVYIYVKVVKHHPKHKKHKKSVPTPKPLPSCESQGMIGTAGNCVQQTNSAEQNCSVSGGKWNHTEQKCKITQINVNCGNVVVVEEVEGPVSVNQPKSENCKTEIVEKPCGCSPVPKPEPPVVNNLQEVQEVYVEKSSLICADVYAPAGDELTITFIAKRGQFSPEVVNTGYGPNGYCDSYTAPSEAQEEHIHVFVLDKTTNLHAESEFESFQVLNPETEHGEFH